MAHGFGAIILAAGESRRMGRCKQLLPWGASTVIGTVAGIALAAPVDEVVVVLGRQANEVVQVLPRGDRRLRWVRNEQHDTGMLSSVCAGIAALSPTCDAFFLFLGDQPMISPQVAWQLARAYEPGQILLPVSAGRRGHPALLSLRYRPEVEALPDSVGLRQLYRQHPEAVREIPVVESSIHLDLDTPEEYEAHRPR